MLTRSVLSICVLWLLVVASGCNKCKSDCEKSADCATKNSAQFKYFRANFVSACSKKCKEASGDEKKLKTLKDLTAKLCEKDVTLGYLRSAVKREALENYLKMYKGAFRYFSKAWADKNGNPMPCQFPASTPWTPKESPCKKGGRYDGSEKWDHPSWKALLFRIAKPHFNQYRIIKKGVGNGSTLTIEARGDISCSGKWTVQRWKLVGVTDATNKLNCRVTRSPAR